MVGVLGVVSGGTCWDVLWWEWWEVGGDLRCCNFVIIMFDHFYRISRLYLTRTLRAKVLLLRSQACCVLADDLGLLAI